LLPLGKVPVTGEKGLLGLFNVPFDEVDAKESEEADSEVFHPGLNGYLANAGLMKYDLTASSLTYTFTS
jgi:hypothetical protein